VAIDRGAAMHFAIRILAAIGLGTVVFVVAWLVLFIRQTDKKLP
jgi:hypothetical protein